MRPVPVPGAAGDEQARLKEIIIYICQKCQDHPRFGAVKLNKILFFADFVAYARRGKSITGETYFKLPFGPAPKRLIPAVEELKGAGAVIEQERPVFARIQKRLIPLREPDLSLFDGFEISLVDEVIEALKDKDAEAVSELSHTFIGWQLVREREEIPYETVFIRDPNDIVITEQRRRRAEEICKRHGLQ
ncbi:MAG: SocA family protein [candidate division Zixibacteria bacterium]|nr:SocA family protein [candidate division Zixibacteria bacterium]